MGPIENGDINGNKREQRSLTHREVEVLQLLALGSSNSEIAGNLDIGVGTTKKHVAAIYQKLGVANRAKATARAIAMGFVNAE